MTNKIITFFQVFIYLPTKFFGVLVIRPKTIYPEGFSVEPGTIILSNHQSRLDPFIVTSILNVGDCLKNFPFRYPVAYRYMGNPILRPFLWLLGSYNVGDTALDKAKMLLRTRDFIKSGYSVLLFPEGKIMNKVEKTELQPGVFRLLSDNVPVVLVRLEGLDSWSWFSFSRYQSKIIFDTIKPEAPIDAKIKSIVDFYSV